MNFIHSFKLHRLQVYKNEQIRQRSQFSQNSQTNRKDTDHHTGVPNPRALDWYRSVAS